MKTFIEILAPAAGGIFGGGVVCAIDYFFRVRPLKKKLKERARELAAK